MVWEMLRAAFEQVLVRLDLRARQMLAQDEFRQGSGADQPAGHPEALDDRAPVEFRRQVIGLDRRIGGRVRRADRNAPAAFGAQLANRHGDPGERVHFQARLVGAERLEMELDIRRRQLRPRLAENAHLAGAHRHRPAPGEDVAQSDRGPSDQVIDLVVKRRDVDLVHRAHLEMVLQVLSDARQFMPDRDAEVAQE